MSLPPLPSEYEDPYFEKRAAFDAAVKSILEGRLSQEGIATFVNSAVTLPAQNAAAAYLASNPGVIDAAEQAVEAAVEGAGILYGASDIDEETVQEDLAWSITDREGRRSWIEILMSGRPSANSRRLIAEALGLTELNELESGYAYAITDSVGRIALGIRPSGEVVIPNLDAEVPTTAPTWRETHIIPLLGQSNMTTYAIPLIAGLNQVHPDVFVIQQSAPNMGAITPATDPLRGPRGPFYDGIGPGFTFGKLYAEQNPGVRVILVPLAKGGVPFRGASSSAGFTWAVDRHDVTNLFDEAVTKTLEAISLAGDLGKPVKIGATLWMQGETDASNGTSQAQYEADLDALITAWRTQVALANNRPFIIGQMAKEFIADPARVTAPGINAAHIDTPRRKTYTSFAYGPPEGYTRGDLVHYAAEGSRRLAASMAEALPRAWKNITGFLPVSPAKVTLTPRGADVVASWEWPHSRVTTYVAESRSNSGAWTEIDRVSDLDCSAVIVAPPSGILEVRIATVNEDGTSPFTTAQINL